MKLPDVVFFYSDDCPYCGPALDAVVPLLGPARLTLLVRKPTPAEAAHPGFGYPAVLLPAEICPQRRPMLLVGQHVAEALRQALASFDRTGA